MEWFKTPRREPTETSDRRVWRSKCGHYRVEEVRYKYGNTVKRGVPQGYPKFYRAMVHHSWGWEIISRHRKLKPAKAAVESYASRD